MKRYTAVVVVSIDTLDICTKLIPNNGTHWKKLLNSHPEFKKEGVEWLSDDYTTALAELKQNGLIIDIHHYDTINPMTKRSKIDNGK